MTLAEIIDEIRRRHGLRDTEIAAVIGISERTLARWMVDNFAPEHHLRVFEAMRRHGVAVSQALDSIYEQLRDLPAPPA